MCCERRNTSEASLGEPSKLQAGLPGQAAPELEEGCRTPKRGGCSRVWSHRDRFSVGGQAAAKRECSALNALLGRVANFIWGFLEGFLGGFFF